MWFWPAAVLMLPMILSAETRRPALLLIAREPLKPGVDAEYRRIETETARSAAILGCPHPYLAAEPLDSLHEIWWFNDFESADDMKRVEAAYAANTAWSEALQRNQKRKQPLTSPPVIVTTRYRSDLSTGRAWTAGQGRFLVIASFGGEPPIPGTVFEAEDGTRFVVRAAASARDARTLARQAGPNAHAFDVRPDLSFPSQGWIDRDPAFWKHQRRNKS